MSNTAYDLLVQKAAELEPEGFLRSFKTDLTKHDRIALEKAGDTEFFWLIGSSSTHIILRNDEPLNLTDSKRRQNVSLTILKEAFMGTTLRDHKVFYYSPASGTLTEMQDADQAIELFQSWD